MMNDNVNDNVNVVSVYATKRTSYVMLAVITLLRMYVGVCSLLNISVTGLGLPARLNVHNGPAQSVEQCRPKKNLPRSHSFRP